ncbi:MAG: outer membrane protein transport protein [Desulfuromonadaceae bacterium]|nr:outer membrane protein transport protein [Desulfuromonadaceae bacterium]
MKNKLVFACILGTLAGTAALAAAAGFKVNEQGAKAMGMANAFVAQADDPSALFYNPAGIAFLKGTQVSLGSLIITVPQTEFTGTTSISGNIPLGNGTSPVYEKAKRDIFISPSLYATYSLESMPLTFGLGVNSIYPLAKSWDSSSVFRNQIENIAIKPINFQPTVAYRFDDLNLSIAAGLDVTHTIVTLQKSAYTNSITGGAPYGAYELGELGVDGTATDLGWNAGILWKPRKDLSFGVAYRSEITLHIKGDANFLATTPAGLSAMGIDYTTIPANAIPFTRARFTSTASTTITLPDSLSLGIAWKPIEKLTLEFDAERTGWSSYDKLEIAFDPSSKLNAFNNRPSPKNWKDVWEYKVGGQYAYNKNIDLRAGYAYDNNPIPDSTLGPELPDSDRHNVSMGMGIHNDTVALDCAYMWVHWVDRTSNNQDNMALTGQNGTLKSDAHLFGANITVKF